MVVIFLGGSNGLPETSVDIGNPQTAKFLDDFGKKNSHHVAMHNSSQKWLCFLSCINKTENIMNIHMIICICKCEMFTRVGMSYVCR